MFKSTGDHGFSTLPVVTAFDSNMKEMSDSRNEKSTFSSVKPGEATYNIRKTRAGS